MDAAPRHWAGPANWWFHRTCPAVERIQLGTHPKCREVGDPALRHHSREGQHAADWGDLRHVSNLSRRFPQKSLTIAIEATLSAQQRTSKPMPPIRFQNPTCTVKKLVSFSARQRSPRSSPLRAESHTTPESKPPHADGTAQVNPRPRQCETTNLPAENARQQTCQPMRRGAGFHHLSWHSSMNTIALMMNPQAPAICISTASQHRFSAQLQFRSTVGRAGANAHAVETCVLITRQLRRHHCLSAKVACLHCPEAGVPRPPVRRGLRCTGY